MTRELWSMIHTVWFIHFDPNMFIWSNLNQNKSASLFFNRPDDIELNGSYEISDPGRHSSKFCVVKLRFFGQFYWNFITTVTEILLTSVAPSSHWIWVYSYWTLNLKMAPEISTIFGLQLLQLWSEINMNFEIKIIF